MQVKRSPMRGLEDLARLSAKPMYLACKVDSRMCSFFLEGKCIYDKGVCWFKHEQLETTENSTIPHKLKEYNCGFCGKLFENKNECMIHRKKEHITSVSECFKNENGGCRFGDEKCWFRHERKMLNSKSKKL
jgi:hypothetical protein